MCSVAWRCFHNISCRAEVLSEFNKVQTSFFFFLMDFVFGGVSENSLTKPLSPRFSLSNAKFPSIDFDIWVCDPFWAQYYERCQVCLEFWFTCRCPAVEPLPFPIELPLFFVKGYYVCVDLFSLICRLIVLSRQPHCLHFSVELSVLSLLSLISNFKMNLSALIKQLVAVLIGIVLSVRHLKRTGIVTILIKKNVGLLWFPS